MHRTCATPTYGMFAEYYNINDNKKYRPCIMWYLTLFQSVAVVCFILFDQSSAASTLSVGVYRATQTPLQTIQPAHC